VSDTLNAELHTFMLKYPSYVVRYWS